MTDTAAALTASRAAHKAKNFQAALDLRLEARMLDPDRRDPAWLDDALAPSRPGIQGKQYHRMPGKTLAEVAALHDVELELFYRQQTGEQPNPIIEPSSQLETRVLVPEHWQTQQAGVTLCVCGHREDEHGGDEGHCLKCTLPFAGCDGYVATKCKHAFEPTSDKLRQCVTCGERQALVPKMAIEDTMAFQQGRKESEARRG